MQQYCNTCGAPITAGMAACARCGTPVTSGGSGAYDPTVRAGSPPGTGYGQQPYGPPPSDPYGAPPPPPSYGSQPPPGYGSQPQPGFGAPPPPPPGFGGQPAGFGGPQPGFGGPPPFGPPPKKRNTWIYVVGGILAVLIVLCVVGIFALRALGNTITNGVNNLATQVATITVTTGDFTQTHTTGPHITQIQTGTGFNTTTGDVEGEKATFTTSEKIWVVYTVANPDAGAVVLVKLLDDTGNLIDSGNSADLDTQTNQYANSVTINTAGIYNIEIDYNGAKEATINFKVTD